jgi:hypothetical protein
MLSWDSVLNESWQLDISALRWFLRLFPASLFAMRRTMQQRTFSESKHSMIPGRN